MDKPFWRLVARLLYPLGSGDQRWWNYEKQNIFALIQHYIVVIGAPLVWTSQVLYIYMYFENYKLIELSGMLIAILLNFLIGSMIYSALSSSYKRLITGFMEYIHLYKYQPITNFSNLTLNNCEKFCKRFSITLGILLCSVITLWDFCPVITNFRIGAYSNRTIRLRSCIYLFWGFDYEYDVIIWSIMYVLIYYFTAVAIAVLFLYEVVLGSIFIHLFGRIDILKHNLGCISETHNQYGDQEMAAYLKQFIEEHIIILRTFKDIQSSYEYTILCYYIFNLIFGAVCLLMFLTGDKMNFITYGLMIVIYMGTFVSICLILEFLCIKSDGLSNAVYALPWEKMSIKNRRTFLMLLQRTQPILEFKILGTRAGIGQVISVIKTTLSYYIMIKSSNVK